MAFGLTVLTMVYPVGHISGGHFNPAVTLGLVSAGKHPASASQAVLAGGEYIKQLWLFVVAPIAGATVAGFANEFLQSDE